MTNGEAVLRKRSGAMAAVHANGPAGAYSRADLQRGRGSSVPKREGGGGAEGHNAQDGSASAGKGTVGQNASKKFASALDRRWVWVPPKCRTSVRTVPRKARVSEYLRKEKGQGTRMGCGPTGGSVSAGRYSAWNGQRAMTARTLHSGGRPSTLEHRRVTNAGTSAASVRKQNKSAPVLDSKAASQSGPRGSGRCNTAPGTGLSQRLGHVTQTQSSGRGRRGARPQAPGAPPPSPRAPGSARRRALSRPPRRRTARPSQKGEGGGGTWDGGSAAALTPPPPHPRGQTCARRGRRATRPLARQDRQQHDLTAADTQGHPTGRPLDASVPGTHSHTKPTGTRWDPQTRTKQVKL